MELTYERIAALNQELPRVDVKGKAYSMVAARVQAFRKLIPGGSITTEIINLDESRVVMRASVAELSSEDAARCLKDLKRTVKDYEAA